MPPLLVRGLDFKKCNWHQLLKKNRFFSQGIVGDDFPQVVTLFWAPERFCKSCGLAGLKVFVVSNSHFLNTTLLFLTLFFSSVRGLENVRKVNAKIEKKAGWRDPSLHETLLGGKSGLQPKKRGRSTHNTENMVV